MDYPQIQATFSRGKCLRIPHPPGALTLSHMKCLLRAGPGPEGDPSPRFICFPPPELNGRLSNSLSLIAAAHFPSLHSRKHHPSPTEQKPGPQFQGPQGSPRWGAPAPGMPGEGTGPILPTEPSVGGGKRPSNEVARMPLSRPTRLARLIRQKEKSRRPSLPRARLRVKAIACHLRLWALRQKGWLLGDRSDLRLPHSRNYISCARPCTKLGARHLWFQALPEHTLRRRQAGASHCCPAICEGSSPLPLQGGRQRGRILRPHPHPCPHPFQNPRVTRAQGLTVG